MGMAYHPVGGPVANQEVRDWHARNYDTDLMSDPDNSLGTLVDYVDEMMITSPGLNYCSDPNIAETRCENEYLEPVGALNCFRWLTTSVEIVHQRDKTSRNIREHYSVNLAQYDEEGEHLSGASYLIVKFVGGKTDMMVQRSIDDIAADLAEDDDYFDKGSSRWSDATEYDATQLFDELSRICKMQVVRRREMTA